MFQITYKLYVYVIKTIVLYYSMKIYLLFVIKLSYLFFTIKVTLLRLGIIYMNNSTKTATTVFFGTAMAFTATTDASAATYTVKAGDSLSKIGAKYGVSYKKIMQQNGLSSTTVHIGQVLKIKKSTSSQASNSSTNTSLKSTYTVKRGDSLSAIASRYGTTHQKLMRVNNLSSTTIFVGQKLTISSKPSNHQASTDNKPSHSTTSTYTVRSGDSLSSIAATYGLTYQKLMGLNDLSSTTIFVGQKLIVSGKAATSSTNSKPSIIPVSNSRDIVTIAKKQLGVPYVFGGANPSGLDCSGFIHYVYNQSGKNIGRTNAAGYYSMATKISTPRIGDLVFFSGTYKRGISHVGFYIGNGQMISAASSGVKIDTIHSGYWSKYFTGYGSL